MAEYDNLTARDRLLCLLIAYIAGAPEEPCLATRDEYLSRRGSELSSDAMRMAADEFLDAFYGKDTVELARFTLDQFDAAEQARELAS